MAAQPTTPSDGLAAKSHNAATQQSTCWASTLQDASLIRGVSVLLVYWFTWRACQKLPKCWPAPATTWGSKSLARMCWPHVLRIEVRRRSCVLVLLRVGCTPHATSGSNSTSTSAQCDANCGRDASASRFQNPQLKLLASGQFTIQHDTLIAKDAANWTITTHQHKCTPLSTQGRRIDVNWNCAVGFSHAPRARAIITQVADLSG